MAVVSVDQKKQQVKGVMDQYVEYLRNQLITILRLCLKRPFSGAMWNLWCLFDGKSSLPAADEKDRFLMVVTNRDAQDVEMNLTAHTERAQTVLFIIYKLWMDPEMDETKRKRRASELFMKCLPWMWLSLDASCGPHCHVSHIKLNPVSTVVA